MVFIILTSVLIISLFLSRILFKIWFNPLAIYTSIWFVLLFLYELKLLRYYPLQVITWFVILIAFLSFLFGVLFYFSVKDYLFNYQEYSFSNLRDNPIFENNGRILLIAIIIIGLIGLLGALQHWSILLKQFGSIQNVFLYAQVVYRMRVEGDLVGVVPYLSAFSFVSLFLAGLYSAYMNKISLITLLPIMAIILKDLANVGRAFMLFALVEFICVFMIARYSMNKKEKTSVQKSKKSLVINFILILSVIIISASFVRSIKGQIEHYKTATSSLKQLNVLDVITPSIYLYFSSHVGVLNKFLEQNNERSMIGEHTFMPAYNIAAKFNLTKNPNSYQKGYFIPMWTNTGTYLRELYSDFGILGVTAGPFLLSFLSVYFFFRFLNEKKIFYLIYTSYLYIVIFFTFLVMVTRLGNWIISLLLTILSVTILERIGKKHIEKNKNLEIE